MIIDLNKHSLEIKLFFYSLLLFAHSMLFLKLHGKVSSIKDNRAYCTSVRDLISDILLIG